MNKVKIIFRFNLLSSIIFLILGLILVIWPSQTITIISNAIGALLLLMGANGIVNYIKYKSSFDVVSGIITIIAGLVLLINPTAVVSVLPFILGIFFIISGISKISYAIEILKYNNKKISPIIMSILITVCGILLVINPLSGAVKITQIIGAYIIFYSILSISNYFTIRKYTKEIESVIIK